MVIRLLQAGNSLLVRGHAHWILHLLQIIRIAAILVFGVLTVNSNAASSLPLQHVSEEWTRSHWLDAPASPPFSFRLGGKFSGEFLGSWGRSVKLVKVLPEQRKYLIEYAQPDGPLRVSCQVVEYLKFPTLEWSVDIVNASEFQSPIVSEALALDISIPVPEPEQSVPISLTRMRGDTYSSNSFEPVTEILGPGANWRFAPVGGRSTNGEAAYYDIRWSDGGVLIGGGWPGQWKTQISRPSQRKINIQFGQELTNFKLLPNEKAILPSVAIQFTTGDGDSFACNTWRKWMLEEVLPKPEGKPLRPSWAANAGQLMDAKGVSVHSQIDYIETYAKGEMHPDFWWMDAGWYPMPKCNVWASTGTWEVDKDRFPTGLGPISLAAKSKGMGTVLWFEPERVAPESWLYNEKPGWLLGSSPAEIDCGGNPNATLSDNSRLLNLGNPEALDWLSNRMDELIRSEGIDVFRFDFNMNPLTAWREGEDGYRVGMTENKYVQGYLAFLDELRKRHPGLLIDTCASGGRRLDLETLRRAFPLLRSDYIFEPIAQQAHTYGLAKWVPFFGSPVPKSTNVYDFQSVMTPMLLTVYKYGFLEKNLAVIKKLIDTNRSVADFLLKDYYPLTKYSVNPNEWMAWQFHDPDLNAGIVQAFRRSARAEGRHSYVLSGVLPDKQYRIEDLNHGTSSTLPGATLLTDGLRIDLTGKAPQAALIRYYEDTGTSAGAGAVRGKVRRNVHAEGR